MKKLIRVLCILPALVVASVQDRTTEYFSPNIVRAMYRNAMKEEE